MRDTGLGVVEDKFRKNQRKTLGLLDDLTGRRTVGVTEIARSVGVGPPLDLVQQLPPLG